MPVCLLTVVKLESWNRQSRAVLLVQNTQRHTKRSNQVVVWYHTGAKFGCFVPSYEECNFLWLVAVASTGHNSGLLNTKGGLAEATLAKFGAMLRDTV